ncbi:MAG: hypothetical protein RIC95_08270 [Vicingaceae bacterium]
MNRLLTKIFATCFLCFSFYACTEDYFEFDKITTDDWRPNLAVPLVNSSLTLEDIILSEDSDGVIVEGQNNILELVYDGQVFATPDSFDIDLPDQNLNTRFTLPTNIPAQSNPQPVSLSDNKLISFSAQVEVDEIKLKEGELALVFRNEFRHNVSLDIELPGFKDVNGQTLTRSVNLFARPAGQANPTPVFRDINLTGFTLDMQYGSNNHSTIAVNVSATINPTPNVGSSAGEAIDIEVRLRDLEFSEFTGFIGQETIGLKEETIKVKLFRNFIAGNLFISNPTLGINVFNGYGAPANIFFNTLKSRNEENANPEINVSMTNNPFVLNYPTSFGVAKTADTLDKDNSNIDFIISSFPRSIIYEAEVRINQGNANGNIRNFITDTSEIGLNVDLRIPFEGVAQGFYLVDTIDLTFDAIDELESGELRIRATNTFPLEASVQLIFTDSLYNPIDSLFEFNSTTGRSAQSIFPPGEPNAPASDIRDFPISRERLQNIAKGDQILVQAFLDTRNANTATPDTVRFRNNNRLDIALGLKGTILID